MENKEIIEKLSNLKRYTCDIEINDDDNAGYLTIKEQKSGEFVKWSDIKKILEKNSK